MKNTKVETIYFGDIIATKNWNNFTTLNFFKKIICIPRKVLPNCNGKETPEEQKYNEKLDKRKGTCRITITKYQIWEITRIWKAIW